MPSVAYTTEMSLLPDAIWAFVKDMDNWAPFMLGYQTHEKQSDEESLWTLRSDVGAMSRIAKFQVNITEWNGPEKVAFTLQGVNEPVKGSGVVTVVELGAAKPAVGRVIGFQPRPATAGQDPVGCASGRQHHPCCVDWPCPQIHLGPQPSLLPLPRSLLGG